MAVSKGEGILDQGYWDGVKPDEKVESRLSRLGQWSLDVLRPSFLRRRSTARKDLGDTAYLDGIRGFAAFLVYWHHHQLWPHEDASPRFENAFGYNGHHYLASFHFIRTFVTGGHFAVAVFFVISGYVLSAKPLRLIHNQEFSKLSDSLASALFRRWFRLFLPILAVSFVYMTFHHMTGSWVALTVWQSNYHDEFWWWYSEFKNFSYVFNSEGEPKFNYNPHVWTIPLEFKGSICVYTCLLAFSRVTRTARLWLEVTLAFTFLYVVDGWPCAAFVMGMLLCDLDMLASLNQLPRIITMCEPYKDLIFYNMFFAGMYLGGVPSFDNDLTAFRDSPGWYLLSFLKPRAVYNYKAFYLFWAATFVVPSIQHISWLRHFFEARFCQYLGRISYALYLVHGPILWVLGDRLYVAVGFVREHHAVGLPNWIGKLDWVPQWGLFGFELNFLLPNLILLPLTLWTAEVVTKVVDQNAVRFAGWAYRRVVAKEYQQQAQAAKGKS